ncbi:MAG: ferrous iron transport protein B [Oscillospiraceae bacterium]|jgi:ferrous iron transport protein B|nr:ferrous iron transport protein B [Oscillospiraceae bacterium]
MPKSTHALKIALAGNPNSGKTTLFNALTGSNQFVGNWPGVTVEKKEGTLKKDSSVLVVDLPGIYSLSPYTLEEVIARNFLIEERPGGILNIIDGTNLERNLYLTTQLLELGIPVVAALNMYDSVKRHGDEIDISKLSQRLGCPVVPISALKGENTDEAINAVMKLIQSGTATKPCRFDGHIEDYITRAESLLPSGVPIGVRRFTAIKLLERDSKIGEAFSDLPDVSAIVAEMEALLGDDTESVFTNERYAFVTNNLHNAFVKSAYVSSSGKVDKILTHKVWALPIFAVIMFLVYYISVTSVGTLVTDFMNEGLFGEGFEFFGKEVPGIPVVIEEALENAEVAGWLQGLILDGIVAGVGAVLGFTPQMFILFLMLSFLEACGYMSRIAFILDKVFRRFGMSGKSFIPILIGTGCGVPGIMASRTIESQRDRRITIMTTTFIPCSAKLPIIALIAGAVFGGAWWVAPSAYFLGIFAIITSGLLLTKLKILSGEPSPFVMELPPYQLPTVKAILSATWERVWSFIKRAGSIILIATALVWFLSRFGFQQNEFVMLDEDSLDGSFLAYAGSFLAFLFKPLGFGTWQATVATLTGLIAKENVVGTLEVLYGGSFAAHFSAAAAYSFLAFNLLCAPCVAAIGAVRREMNSNKWTLIAVGYQTAFAYVCAFIIYQILCLIL